MALITVERTYSHIGEMGEIHRKIQVESERESSKPKIVNEYYFAVRGAALVLQHEECIHVKRSSKKAANDIQKHLQSMFFLLRPEDTLKMAVKLESAHHGRTRYLVVITVASNFSPNNEESCLLGVDFNYNATIGLVMPVWADTNITLDGDGGFSITSSGRHHIFKPVSVQAMWSALQTLHKVSAKARENIYFAGGSTHSWVRYYEERINSDRSCLNEWNAMDDLVYKRPPSPDIRVKPLEQEEIERTIRAKLKEIMMSVDLDEIRSKLETELDLDLNEYKSFIDEEMLTILGQMDEPSQIFDYLYLGSEWNASNLDELKGKRVEKILNVTREIDNFFPGSFDYCNVRVYDDDSTEMLRYWDDTFKYIRKAKEEGSRVLVHCKMGISRSASVVIAYVMKAYNWNLQKAMEFVKIKRNCIRPNESFLKQLEIYQGILDASKQRHSSLWRSKSETNLNSLNEKCLRKCQNELNKNDIYKQSHKPDSSNKENSAHFLMIPGTIERPKSWSPSDSTLNDYLSQLDVPSQRLTSKDLKNRRSLIGRQRFCTDPSCYLIFQSRKSEEISKSDANSLMHDTDFQESFKGSDTHPFTNLHSEAVKINTKAGVVLNLANQINQSSTFELSKMENLRNNDQNMNKEVFSDMSNFNTIQNPPLHSKPPVPKLPTKFSTLNEKMDKSMRSDVTQKSVNKIKNDLLYSKSCPNKQRQLTDVRQKFGNFSSLFVDDVGFVPYGNVLQTKRKIEENEMKRTASYESLSCEYMKTSDKHDTETRISKSHRRTKSLFSGSQKLIPLPSLSSGFRSLHESYSFDDSYGRKQKSTLTQSKSTPSVFEAVNEVLTNTQIILNSAIESIPKGKTLKTREFDNTCELLKKKSDLYNKIWTSEHTFENKRVLLNKSQARIASDESSSSSTKNTSLPTIIIDGHKKNKKLESSKKVNDPPNGVVKRLTKELEAKAKGKDFGVTNEKSDKRTIIRQTSKSTPASPNVGRVTRPRSSTFNEFMDPSVAPPAPSRKTSLDLSLRQNHNDAPPKAFDPLIKLPKKKKVSNLPPVNHGNINIGPLIEHQFRNISELQKRTHMGKKQQGKSHPLSRLTT